MRKTKEEKIAAGTYRPDQHKEFKPLSLGRLLTVPEPPEWLNDTGKDYFRELAEILFNASVLQPSDIHMLALLCGELSRYREAYTKLQEQGQVVKIPNGYHKQSEYVRISEKAFTGACELAGRFGLDLAGRVKIPEMMKPPRIEYDSFLTNIDRNFWQRHFGHLNNASLHGLIKDLEAYVKDRERTGKDVEYKYKI